MRIEQRSWNQKSGWTTFGEAGPGAAASLVLAFGSREALGTPERFSELQELYPEADIILAGTAGEIQDITVLDESIAVTAIVFERTRVRAAAINIHDFPDSRRAGEALSRELREADLAHIFVLSDGVHVNGSELVIGLNEGMPPELPITGGLAGDAARFEKTLVGLNEFPGEGRIVALGLYGDGLRVGHGSFGGWDPFGPERTITRSQANILHELDGESALELYKLYLGDQAAGLPGTALKFPLSINIPGAEKPITRTILGINEQDQSMIFAGDMPEGSTARLMRANFERLIDGAHTAADMSLRPLRNANAELAVCISCVGRKLVLGGRIEEELEEVREVLGPGPVMTGFYSYGEISPFTPSARCELHNQTMTITTLLEE